MSTPLYAPGVPSTNSIIEAGLGGIIVIGLTGKAGCGKSTAALNVCQQYKSAVNMDFATPIRDMIMALDNSRNKPYSKKVTKVNSLWMVKQEVRGLNFIGTRTYRHLMQTLGTEWGRDLVDKDLWVVKLFDSMINCNKLYRKGVTPIVVIDGIRFQNEVEFISNFPNHLFIEIERDKLSAGISEKEKQHSSEDGVSQFTPGETTARIINDGSIFDLSHALKTLIDNAFMDNTPGGPVPGLGDHILCK